MSVSRVKTWGAETLTFADLNAEFDNILNNGEDLAWPATKAKDLDGQELILDSDGDTSITADTDDRVDVRAGGQDIVRFDGTTASSVNFLDLASRATGVAPVVKSRGEANTGLVIQDSNGNEALILGSVASAVNEITITNAATTSAPAIRSSGEADVGITIRDSNNNELIIGAATGSAVNEITVTNAATTGAPSIAASGGDTNVALNLASKGSSGVQHNGVTVGALGSIQVFTSSDTYTKPSGLRFALVEVHGGGGGGGGAASAANTAAGGGGGGGHTREFLAAGDIGATETVTVGGGGSGGSAGANNGSAGGTTSFGALLSATGGAGGAGASGVSGTGGAGGAGANGDADASGNVGQSGMAASVTVRGGTGGGGGLAGGGGGGVTNGAGANGGRTGGGGGAASNAGGALAGGNGGGGIVIVLEFY